MTSYSEMSHPTTDAPYRGETRPEITPDMERIYPNICMARIGLRQRYLEARQEGIDSALALLLQLPDRTAFNLVQAELGTPSRSEFRELDTQARAIWSREVGRPESEAPDMRRFGDRR